jgi:hypothetical protein
MRPKLPLVQAAARRSQRLWPSGMIPSIVLALFALKFIDRSQSAALWKWRCSGTTDRQVPDQKVGSIKLRADQIPVVQPCQCSQLCPSRHLRNAVQEHRHLRYLLSTVVPTVLYKILIFQEAASPLSLPSHDRLRVLHSRPAALGQGV